MKNFYIAVTVKQNRNENIFDERISPEYNAGYYAYIIPCAENDNIKARLDMIGGLIHANIYQTKKRAAEIVAAWNAAYKANGTYLFDDTF
jgi:hypothetical protein